MESVDDYLFSGKDYYWTVNWESDLKSDFETNLEKLWLSKEKMFRYKLMMEDTKRIRGDYEFLAQLNINRAVNRRPPEDIRCVKQPFSEDKFNFTKISKEELMFSLVKENHGNKSDVDKDYFIINVSPLEYCHCLLCPSMYKRLNQIITKESLHFALNTILLSSSPSLRIGFNSLCAYATVNHLHLHAYYLGEPMKLETIKVQHLSGRCYILEDFPSKGYVFQLSSASDIPLIVEDVYKLTSFLTNEDIAHNMYVTRGLNFDSAALGERTSRRDVIRIFIWARTSSYGAKTLDAFNPALCELFGHLVVKTKEAFENLDEETVANTLDSITQGPYSTTKDKVKQIFTD